MQGMLFPPLEDEVASSDLNGVHDGSRSSQVLPLELRDRFSKVRSLLRENASTEESAADLKRKQEETALDTARAVQEEVSRLQNGIAELEAMYAQQQQEERQQRRQQAVLENVHVVGENEGYMDSDLEEGDDEEDDGQGGPPPPLLAPGNYQNIDLPSLVNAIEPDLDDDNAANRQGSERESSAEPMMTNEDILCDAWESHD